MTSSTAFATALRQLSRGEKLPVGSTSDADGGQIVRARRGQLVFHETDPSDTVYLLVEGEVRLYVARSDDETREKTTQLLAAPAVFGDRDVLADVAARESAVCLAPAQLLAFDAEVFRRAASDRDLRADLAIDLAERHAKCLLLLRHQAGPVVQLVGALLREEARRGRTVMPSLEVIATLAGVPNKSVSRALGQLREAGALAEQGLQLNEEGLEKVGLHDCGPLFHSVHAV